MAEVEITYKGGTIASMNASGNKNLLTSGKYCEDNIIVTYSRPSGGGDISYTEFAKFMEGKQSNIDFSNLTNVRTYAFAAANIETLFLPYITTIGVYTFTNSYITVIVLPTLASMTTNAFRTATRLEKVDLGKNLNSISSYGFYSDGALDTVILRNDTQVVGIGNITAFGATPFASGGSGGTIYIPKSLYDHLGDGTALDYKAASNWSTLDAYGTITWAKIEGSQYENYYADGTPIT